MSTAIDLEQAHAEAYARFIEWASTRPQWADLAWALEHYDLQADFASAIRTLTVPRPPPSRVTIEGPLGAPPTTSNYDSWSEPKRRAANLDALRVLRRLQAEQQVAAPADLAYLRAYSGWGGIDVRQLPPDPVLFPPEYVEGIEEWRTAADRGQIPSSGVFAGLRHQFFTPIPVVEAMWGLARKVAPFPLTTALEPTAGIGRFLQATPSDLGVLWTAVENDPLLVQLSQAAYPTAEVIGGSFEQFYLDAVAQGREYDLVLINPPYGDRPQADRKVDSDGAGWSNHTYFVERASRLLRPGGVLVAITPASEIIGTDIENKRFREWLLGRCHFAGAVFPPSNIFPHVNPGMNAFAIHAWVRLPDGAPRRLTIEEQRVLDGSYLDTPSGAHNTIGTWVEAVEGRPSVQGVFDPARVVGASVRPMGITEMVALKEWRRAHPPAAPQARAPVPPPSAEAAEVEVQPVRVKTPRVRTPRPTRPAEVLSGPVALSRMTAAAFGVVEEATAFSYRVQRFGALANSNAEVAEQGRSELRADLEEFVRRYGSPHEIPEVRANPGCTHLLSAIQTDGSLAPLLAQALAIIDVPPSGADVFEVIDWYSRRYGVCTERDLARHVHPEDVEATLPDLLVSPDYAIEPRAEESWFYTVRDYLSGDLYAKLDALDAALAGTVGDALREKLTGQKILLLQTIEPRTLADITVTPRSGFVPIECLSAYVNFALGRMGSKPTGVQLVIDQGLLRAVAGTADGLYDVQTTWLQQFLGYWNRQLSVVDPNEKEAKRTDVFDTSDVSMRLKLEKKLEDEFRRWVAIDENWRQIVEDKYNRLFRGHRPREYADAPLGLARNHAAVYTPKPHQNSAARKVAEKLGGILALDVGAGKTITGLASVADLRQSGRIRRPIIVVPNNIIFKWYRDARKLLPDYRVGIIGYSIKPEAGGRGASKDSVEERTTKWRKFAEGAYDLLIVPFSNFLNDVELSDKSTYDILSKILWLQRKLGVDAEERRLLQRRIEDARKKMGEAQNDLAWAQRNNDERALEQATKKLASLTEKMEKWAEKLKQPSAAEIEQVRMDLDGITNTKPFRPRARAPKAWSSGAKKPELLKYLLDVGFGDALNVETGAVNPEIARQFVTGTVADMEAMSRFDWNGSGQLSKPRLLEILRTFFPPQASGTVPRPGLVTWESLNVDFMVVDEAHNFKNVWYPQCRLGVSRISYMGSCGQQIAPKPWDMFLKTQYLLGSRGADGGVMLLTATPIKNGPIEVYNLLTLVSRYVWSQREVRSAEEFVDRYCTLADEVTVNPTSFSAEMNLGMSGFQNLDELRAIMDLYMERKTIDDLLALGVLDRVPKPLSETVPVVMDRKQLEIYKAVREEIKAEIEKAKEAGDKAAGGGMILLQMDMLSKVALDPRLLQKDVAELRETLAEQAQVEAAYNAWLKGGRRGKEPKAPLADEVAEFLGKRLDLLERLGIETITEDYAKSGDILPKYVELAQFVRRNAACGHIVFSDFNDTHEFIADAISAIVGPETLPRSRIAIVTGDLDPDERQQISDDFNGADQEIDEATGVVIAEAREPLYDVIIGNSAVMSEGIDLQRRTCAIHHMNLPWEPATLQQRNGRGVRQGNQLEAVAIRYYIAERSFDGFKFDMVFGKGEWQKTLFDPGVRQMSNPAAGSTLSREEALVWLVAENPEEAKRLIEQVMKQKEAYVRARQRDEAKSRFSSLVDQYAQARKQTDPAAQQALFASADRLAAELRLMPDEAFPNKDVLEVARDYPVFYDFDTGLYFHQGEYVCFGSAGEYEQDIRLRVEIMRVDPTPGGAYFIVRGFGTPTMRGDFALSGLLGRGRTGPVIRLPLDQCGGWDPVEDERLILDRDLSIGNVLELGTLYDRLIDRLWPILVERGLTIGGSYLVDSSDVGLTPLINEAGEILLLPFDTIDSVSDRRGDREDAVRTILDAWRLIPPLRRESWAAFSNAFQKDNVWVLGRVAGVYQPVPLNLDDPRRSVEFKKTMHRWFNRPEGMPPGMMRTWKAARERRERRAAQEVEAPV